MKTTRQESQLRKIGTFHPFQPDGWSFLLFIQFLHFSLTVPTPFFTLSPLPHVAALWAFPPLIAGWSLCLQTRYAAKHQAKIPGGWPSFPKGAHPRHGQVQSLFLYFQENVPIPESLNSWAILSSGEGGETWPKPGVHFYVPTFESSSCPRAGDRTERSLNMWKDVQADELHVLLLLLVLLGNSSESSPHLPSAILAFGGKRTQKGNCFMPPPQPQLPLGPLYPTVNSQGHPPNSSWSTHWAVCTLSGLETGSEVT